MEMEERGGERRGEEERGGEGESPSHGRLLAPAPGPGRRHINISLPSACIKKTESIFKLEITKYWHYNTLPYKSKVEKEFVIFFCMNIFS